MSLYAIGMIKTVISHYIRSLKQALNHGLIFQKCIKQLNLMKKHVWNVKTILEFEKDFFKLNMN